MEIKKAFAVFVLFSMFAIPGISSAALPAGFEIETIASGLNTPTALAFVPDGRIFIAQKNGTVRVYKNGALLASPLIVLTDVNNYGDRGLIGIATDPNFLTNGYLYLSYTYENTPGANFAGTKTGRIVRVRVVGDSASESSKVVLVGTVGGDITKPSCQNYSAGTDCIPSDSSSHSVGGLRFGPDGKLYASLGDGSSFDDVDVNALRAQDLDSLAGKLLRINTDGTAPLDNPFYNGSPTSNRSKVYAYGLRNMYRFNFQPGTGTLFGGDVGWSTWEEVNKITSGGNYGWPCREGVFSNAGYACTAPGAIDPFYTYAHNAFGAGSITSGAFPSGSAYPTQYANSFFFGDYAQNWIKQMIVTASGTLSTIIDFASGADDTNGPVEFVTGPEGNVYFIAIYTGEIKRITHTSGNRQPIVHIGANVSSGLAPLSVNFSSAGTNDPDGDPVTFLWNFQDGTTSTLANPSHSFSANGNYQVLLTVRDNRGGVQTKSILITVGNQKPTAHIISPLSGSLYTPGATLTLSGSGTDPENGTLPSSALSWRVILHHNIHTHVLETHIGNNISITGADHGDPDVYTEIELAVTDSGGLVSTSSVNIYLNNGGGQSGNLIQNASFEEVDTLNASLPRNWSTDWWGNLVPVFTYPVVGYEGASSRAAKVQVTQYTEGDAKWVFSPAFVDGNTPLTFSSYYKSDATTVLVAEIGYVDGSLSYVNLGSVPPASTWTKLEKTFTTPPNSRYVSVLHVLVSVGNLSVDNYSLLSGSSTPPTPPPPPPATNLLTNPSFETANGGDPMGWHRGGWGPNDRSFTYPVAGRTGAKAVETKLVTYTDGDTKWYPDNVAVTPGVQYSYSDWYKADDISDIIGEYTMNDGTLVYFGVAKELVPTTVWKQASGSFVPPPGAVSATFMHLISSPATLTIDDASLTTSTGGYVDVEHPAVTITQPLASSTVSGSVTLAADAIDNIGVASVQFFVDGSPLGAPDTTAPYGMVWESAGFANGLHSLAARALDTSGISATNTIAITVSNSVATTTNPNLIVNSSFESSDVAGNPSSWSKGNWGTNTVVFTYPTAGFSTPKGAQIQMTTHTNGDAKWFFAPVAVTPGTPYQFSNRYKSDVSTTVVLRYTFGDNSFSYVVLGTAPASLNWASYSSEIVPPAGAVAVTVFHIIDRVGTLTVDDYVLSSASGQTDPNLFSQGMVSLTFDDGWLSHYTNALPALNAANMNGSFGIISLETLDALPYNRILNPSLETGDGAGGPANWVQGNWGTNNAVFTYPVSGQDGANAANVTMTSHVDGDAKWFFKDSAVVDGAEYAVSDYYLSDATTTVTARYNMGNNVFVYVDIATLPPRATWTQFTKLVTIPANVESFTFFHRLDGVGSLTIDHANFSKVQIYLSPAQVLEMQGSGHEIVSHTRTHPSLSSIPTLQMQNEVSGSRSDLLGMGATAVSVLVYPYGDYNPDVVSAIQLAGYVGARSVDRGYNNKSSDKYTLKIQQVDITTTIDQVKTWVDTAVQNKTWLILMLHQVDAVGGELSTTPQNLQAMIDYLVATQVPVVTMQEGIAQMN